jgi:hypothetical protein
VSNFPDVDLLDRAATRMRELALAADSPGPGWGDMLMSYLGGPVGSHCSVWTPAVAVAVAEWLQIGANQYACVDRTPMVKVAREFLGEQDRELVPVGPWVRAECGCVWRESRPAGLKLDPDAPRVCATHLADHPKSLGASSQGMAMVAVVYHQTDPRGAES